MEKKKKKRLRIAIDARPLEGNGGGIYRYVSELTNYIVRQGDIPVLITTRKLRNQFSGAENVVIQQKFHRLIWEQIQLPLALRNKDIDLYHAAGSWGAPLFTKLPVITTIHDIIPLLKKDYFSKSKYPLLSKALYYLRMKLSASKSKRIIVTNDIIKKDLVRVVGANLHKLVTIPMGIDEKFFEKQQNADAVYLNSLGISGQYILNFGGVDERKNLAMLLQAFKSYIISTTGKENLVITGGTEEKRKVLREVGESYSIGDRVIFTGWVDKAKLPLLVRNADFTIYLSQSEGFGFPVLESMAAGAPVVASDLPVLKKPAGNVPVFVDQNSEADIVTGMKKAIGKKTKNECENGIRIARSFTWVQTLERTYLEYYNLFN